MRKITLLLTLAIMGAILFGCQSEDKATTKAAKTNNELQSQDNDNLTLEAEITKVSISKSKGVSPTVFEEGEALETFRSLFSSAVKEEGIANMANPEFYLDVIDANDNKYSFHLWIGEKGQRSALMKTDDTHTLFTVSEDMTDKLIELVEK
jgi:hypothetical protein